MPRPLNETERSALAGDLPEWSLDGETISRTFTFDDFAAAMGFVTSVALAAEAADHHPDIDIRWNRVTLALTTHSEDALTEADRDLALRADGLA
jgi:4a-hydroxytetrahydrobiopterin dehydratase